MQLKDSILNSKVSEFETSSATRFVRATHTDESCGQPYFCSLFCSSILLPVQKASTLIQFTFSLLQWPGIQIKRKLKQAEDKLEKVAYANKLWSELTHIQPIAGHLPANSVSEFHRTTQRPPPRNSKKENARTPAGKQNAQPRCLTPAPSARPMRTTGYSPRFDPFAVMWRCGCQLKQGRAPVQTMGCAVRTSLSLAIQCKMKSKPACKTEYRWWLFVAGQ